MIELVIRQFSRSLQNLQKILDKAKAHAEKNNFNPDLFLSDKLVTDMFPLAKQVQIVTDIAKITTANLLAREAPKWEDTEKTFAEIQQRLEKAVAHLNGYSSADFGSYQADRAIKMTNPKDKFLRSEDYLYQRQVPNFYFHATMIYALLRKSGVNLGKSDHLGNLPFIEP